MVEYNDEKLRMMEDEMNRFEAEIGIPVPPMLAARPVIGANTYHQVQRRLEEQQMPEFHPGIFAPPMIPIVPTVPPAMAGFVGIPPPPPPPPPLLIPHQVQHRPMQPPRGPPLAPPLAPPPGTAVLSMAPMLYNPKTPSANVDEVYTNFRQELNQLAEHKPQAKKAKIDMAEKFKPVTVAPTPAVEEPQPTAQGRKKKNKKLVRMAGGQIWEDNSLGEWEDDDYRIFCGDLGNDVTDEILTRTFNKYPSFLKAKVVRDKRSNKTKGFGFVSFKDPQDFIKAMKEMNGRYVGSRPIKLRKSTWKSRNLDNVRKKEKEKTALIGLLTGR